MKIKARWAWKETRQTRSV